MPITGHFDADFASFYDACRQAEVSLKGFDASTKGVEKSINSMVDSFTGRRVISEATLMTEAVRRIGGPMRLTEAEARRVSDVAEEAIAKFRRWGQEIPPNIQRVADATRGANNNLSAAAGSIRQVDNVLDLLGIHLGPARKGIDDLGFALEQGADKLGAVATAGLAVGAAVAGWKIGRAAADFLDLDKKIGDATAKLLGFGDVAGQTAAAQADSMAKASKIAGFEVTNYSLALMINAQEAKKVTEANKDMDDVLARQAGPAFAAQKLAEYNQELSDLKSQGLLDDLTKDINSHAFSMEQLSKWYRVSTEALSLFAGEAAKVDRIEKNNADKLAKLTQDFRAAERQQAEDEKKAAEAKRIADSENLHQRAAAQAAIHEQEAQLAEQQLRARLEVEKTTRALREEEEAARAAARSIGNSIDFDLSTPEGLAQFKRLNPNASISGAATSTDYFKTHSIADAVRDGLIDFNSRLSGGGRPQQSPGGVSPPLRNFAVVEELGPIPFAPASSARAGSTSRAERGITINQNVHVSGVFDPQSKTALANAVSDSTMRRVLATSLG